MSRSASHTIHGSVAEGGNDVPPSISTVHLTSPESLSVDGGVGGTTYGDGFAVGVWTRMGSRGFANLFEKRDGHLA